jgi:hypothetical protein
MLATAHPTSPSAAAHAPARSTLELLEARQLRDALKNLLRREQAAMADFLVALADFDRRRGWEALGHANLFAFLPVELRLSKSAAFYRKSAAELLQGFPEVIEPLRDGRHCLSTVAELAKVLTDENRDVVAPRFFGLSAREAQELVAELQPRQVPSTRMVVTRVLDRSVAPAACTAEHPLTLAFRSESVPPFGDAPALLAFAPQFPLSAGTHPTEVPPSRVLTSDFANGGGGRPLTRRDEIEPLTADLRRLHVTVSRRFLEKLTAARDGLSHAIPGATTEQVLEDALDLLLEKQARARGQVKRPRNTPPVTVPRVGATGAAPGAQRNPPPLALAPTDPPPPRRAGPREAIPAAVKRAVWARDGGRCSWLLDGGGVCASTNRLELDHLVPWAMGGEATVANLRLTCARHNRLAARQAFGSRCVERYAAKR